MHRPIKLLIELNLLQNTNSFANDKSLLLLNVKLKYAEPVEGPSAPPGRGGLTYAQGPHVTYEKKILVF